MSVFKIPRNPNSKPELSISEMYNALNDDNKRFVDGQFEKSLRELFIKQFYQIDQYTQKEIDDINDTEPKVRALQEKINDILNIQPKLDYVIQKNNETKEEYSIEILDIYNSLKNELESVINKNLFKFKMSISGNMFITSSDCYCVRPTLSRWIQLNPNKYSAINVFISELRYHGWNPTVELEDIVIDHDDGMYMSGTKIIIECDLFYGMIPKYHI